MAGPGGQAPPPAEEEDITPDDELIRFWLDRLSRQQNFKLASEFAGLVKTNKIQPDVYYAVVDELLVDPRAGIQLVGAYLLGSYQSAQSFEKLVLAEKEAPFGSRLNKQIEVYIEAYEKLNNVKFLSTVLNTGTDLTIIRKAIDLVQGAAQKQLRKGIEPQGSEAPTQHSESDASIFRGFLSVLEDLANSIGDQQIAKQASDLLAQLQNMIPNSDPSQIAENSNPDTNS